jgi:DNA polymerase-4/DNA polymerase V
MSESTNKHTITLASYPRAIVHIDGDAFFASCEQARNPSLKGQPVITGKERGIVSCASYEAKACGVQRGVRLFEARQRCPHAVIIPSDYELYSIYSERMLTIIRRFTPSVEEFSIDEGFCDVTGLRRIYRTSYPAIARMIKQEITKELDITVSVGVSLSKTLAKMCSRHQKPNGFTAVPGYRLHQFLRDMPLDAVCGFGPNTVALLHKCGVKTVLDYVERPLSFAQKLLGKIGTELWHELRGDYIYELSTEKKEKYLSISKTKTFMPSSSDKDFVKGQLIRNLESACIKLRRHHLSARNLTAYLRRADFNHVAMEARLNRHSSSTLDFSWICSELFEVLFREGMMYRATGIILSDIVAEGIDTRTLFDDPIKIERMLRVSKAIDRINKMFGKHAIHVASSHIVSTRKRNHMRNDLAWRKKHLLKGETFRKRLTIPLLKLK